MSKKTKILISVLIPVLILVAVFLFVWPFHLLNGIGGARNDEGGYYGVLSKEASYELGSVDGFAEAVPMTSSSVSDDSSVVDRMIIKTGTVSMVVEDVKVAIKAISDYAVKNGGFVVSSNISKDGISPYGEITIRILADVFDKGILDVKAMGEVTSEGVYGQDVTEEYVDLDAQIKNLRATEEQFLNIMKDAYKIEDVLAVQRELGYVRGEIDRIAGRMKYLKQSAELATITVYLSTSADSLPVVNGEESWKPFAVLKDAFRSLVDFGKGIVDFAIWGVVYLPVVLLFGLCGYGLYRLIRKIWD